MKKTIFILAAVAVTATVASAQTNSLPVSTTGGLNAQALSTLWTGLCVTSVPIVVLGIKKWLPKLPKIAWPFLAVIVGVVADWLLGQSGAIKNSAWQVGALCGAAGIGLREILKQVTAMAVTGDVVDTSVTPVLPAACSAPAEPLTPPPAPTVTITPPADKA